MAIADAGSPYTAGATNSSGAQSVTDVTIPSGVSIAIIHFSFFYSGAQTISNVSLDGQTATKITEILNTSNDMCADFWVTGISAGSGKVLNWTAGAGNELGNSFGIGISFLSGTDTSAPIRDFNASNTSGATVTFSSGDWTMLSYISDTAASPTNGGANTAIVAESAAMGGGPVFGMYYRSVDGTVALGGGTFLGTLVYSIKPASSGPGAGSDVSMVTVSEATTNRITVHIIEETS